MPTTWTHISTATVTAATQTSIVFDLIPATYSDLMLIGSVRSTRSGGDAALLMMRMNDVASSYIWNSMNSNAAGSAFGLSESYDSTRVMNGYHSQSTANQADTYSGYQITIPNRFSAGNPFYVSYGAQEINGSGNYISFASGSNTSISSSITKLEFYSEPLASFQFVQHSTISLYGLIRA